MALAYSVWRIRIRDTGSGAFLTPGPGSRIRSRFFSGSRISDPRSRIPTPYFLELSNKFLGKKFYNFFLQHLKNKIILNFVKFVATKKGLTTNLFSPLSFLAVLGSGIRDPGSGMGKNQDPGSGINIPDQQHCA
jgi:hypothetical protein